MPHLTLEYSVNLKKINFENLFQKCHRMLAKELPTELASCKSRARACKQYLFGEGLPMDAFIYLNLKIMSGRSSETLHRVAQQLIHLLEEAFAQYQPKLNLEISIEIVEIEKNYFKHVCKATATTIESKKLKTPLAKL